MTFRALDPAVFWIYLAEQPLFFLHQALFRGVMKVNPQVVRKHELDPAHEVALARQLPHAQLFFAGQDAGPIDFGRIDLARIVVIA